MASTPACTVADIVAESLSVVLDSCSVAAGNPLSIVDMGLVHDVSLDDDGVLHVTLRGTFPGCTMLPHFAEAAERELSRAFDHVDVHLSTDVSWTPDQMSAGAHRALRERRAAVPVNVVPWALRQGAAH